MHNLPSPPRRFCVAPMMDWTDRHCRYFHRQLTGCAWLYSEMVTTAALLHGDVARHLDFDPSEQPVALQLGGSEPHDLAYAARLGERWGYAEINLNCGCPSERVQRGAFGACLMAEPQLVADCVKAMQDVVTIPISVKHRIGIERIEDYRCMRDFVGALAHVGCKIFIVHARNAWLKGLSPKENRCIPPLRYDLVYQLKREFPELQIILNGGLVSPEQIDAALTQVDGVMVGREAYHNPYLLAQVDARWYGVQTTPPTRAAITQAMIEYVSRHTHTHISAQAVVRHILGLYHGQPGARRWRQFLSNSQGWENAGAELIRAAENSIAGGL